MLWERVEVVASLVQLASGYSLRSATNEDLPSMIRCIRSWYPGAVVGSESRFLNLNYYRRYFCLSPRQKKRSFYAILIMRGCHKVGVFILRKDNEAQSLVGVSGAIAPKHRGRGIALVAPQILHHLGRKMGAELAYYYGSLQIAQTQRAAESGGFQLVGIMPGHDIDKRPDGTVGRVSEAIYAKLLVAPSKIIPPNKEYFTPQTKRVWNTLFKDAVA